jgi:DNA primase
MTDIREIAEKYLERVRPAGPYDIVSLCPFHTERDPSFSMSVMSGLWICFSCGEKGNLRQFLQRMGLSSYDIKIGYTRVLEEAQKNRPPPPDPARPNVYTKDPLPEEILGLFQAYPTELLNAGFSEETLRFFEVGFDKWHSRITFPIRDLKGNLLGINGRAVEDGVEPRYKVYNKEYAVWDLPEREQVNKSAVLWNAHTLYPYVHFQKSPAFVVLVEGYKACMWMYQHGVHDVLALQGRLLSPDQKWILERIGAPVHLMLDNNEAGWNGMGKIARVLSPSLPVKIVDYDTEQPDGLPPEQVLRVANDAQDWLKVLLEVS